MRREAWAKMRQAGWGGRGRVLSTWRNGRRRDDAPEQRSALGELLARWSNVEIDPDFADRLGDELATDDGRTTLAAVLAGITAGVRAAAG